MVDSPPVCTVIIPARNASRTLPSCLRALHTQTLDDFRVIVVDDGSQDNTAAIATALGAQVIRQAPLGPAAARNRGLAEAGTDFVLFTDADCSPHADWIERMVSTLSSGQVIGCRGFYATRQTSPIARFVQLDYEDRYRRQRRLPSLDFIDTYSAGYRRDSLVRAGGFDETFRHASVEDQELSFRLTRDGCHMVPAPEAVVEHVHPATWGQYVRKKFKIGLHKPQVHLRHRSRLVADSHTPMVLRLQVAVVLCVLCLAPLALLARPARRLSVLGLAAVMTSSIPFSVRNLFKDPVIGMLTPLLVLVRAACLGSGLLAGLVRLSIHCFATKLPTSESNGRVNS